MLSLEKIIFPRGGDSNKKPLSMPQVPSQNMVSVDPKEISAMTKGSMVNNGSVVNNGFVVNNGAMANGAVGRDILIDLKQK